MQPSLKAGVIGQQDLPSPNCAVSPVTSAIKGETDNRLFAIPAVVRQAGTDVGVVMLNIDQGQVLVFCPCLGIAGSQVIRVQITGDQLGLDAKNCLIMIDCFCEGIQCFLIFQVADVMTQEGVSITG